MVLSLAYAGYSYVSARREAEAAALAAQAAARTSSIITSFFTFAFLGMGAYAYFRGWLPASLSPSLLLEKLVRYVPPLLADLVRYTGPLLAELVRYARCAQSLVIGQLVRYVGWPSPEEGEDGVNDEQAASPPTMPRRRASRGSAKRTK